MIRRLVLSKSANVHHNLPHIKILLGHRPLGATHQLVARDFVPFYIKYEVYMIS
jgi:hypothetical protein